MEAAVPRTNRDKQDPTKADRPLPAPDGAGGTVSEYVRRLLILVLVVAVAAVCVVAMRMLCVVFAGLLFGVFLYRLSTVVQQHTPLSYRASLATVNGTLLGLFAGVGFLLVPRLAAQFGDLSSKVMSSGKELMARLNQSGWMDEVAQQAPQLGSRLLGSLDATSLLGGAFSSLTLALTTGVLILFVGFFLAIDPGLYRRGFLLLVPPLRRQQADELLRKGVDTLWWWTVGRLVAMTIIGVATSVGLWLLGIPLAVTLGTLAGVLSFVPTIGAVLAIIPAMLVAFQQGPLDPLYVLALYLGIQAVESNLLTPVVQQKAVSIPPVILIVSQVVMGLLVGIVGVAIATPLAALVIELIRETYVEKPPAGSASTASAGNCLG